MCTSADVQNTLVVTAISECPSHEVEGVTSDVLVRMRAERDSRVGFIVRFNLTIIPFFVFFFSPKTGVCLQLHIDALLRDIDDFGGSPLRELYRAS